MPLPRCQQISLTETPYYHCVSRCVRRAYLCGTDEITGRNYEHRRQWVEDRILFLSTVFCIDICAYAVMHNHAHIVLHVDKSEALKLSNTEVVRRWRNLHKPTLLAQTLLDNNAVTLSEEERATLDATLLIYRKRLFDISWFMRALNEFIAREANKEDDCTGHFWEGRFKSQALLDEHALAACMAYVDLNPIRANIASTPESSSYTSIKRRMSDVKRGHQPTHLMPFVGNPRRKQPKGLTYDLLDYIHLVELSGRVLVPSKGAKVNVGQSPILKRLGMNEQIWEALIQRFESTFSTAAGAFDSLKKYKMRTNRKRITSTKLCI